MVEITLPQNITRALILDLRIRGKRKEAEELLKVRKAWMKSERKNDKKEIAEKHRKMKVFLIKREEREKDLNTS